MIQPKNKLLLLLALLSVVFAGNLINAMALPGQDEPLSPTDSLSKPDSISVTADNEIPALPPDTLKSVELEPIMYDLGRDSVLIKAFAPAIKDTISLSSPTVALFKSVVFPGWGQYSNRKYLKAGLVFAIESYFIYKAINNGHQASDWHDKWKATPDSLSSLQIEYFNKYTRYRNQRNTDIWYTAVTIFISMFDAYVDAHLARFPRKTPKPEDLSIDFIPGFEPRVNISYNF